MRRAASTLAAALALVVPRAAVADEPVFGLAITVAEVDRKPVASEEWIAAQLKAAQQLFGPIGVHLRWALAKPMAGRFAVMDSRADRDALGSELEGRFINVLVVGRLRDVDDPSRDRMGVCWQNQRDPRKRYIVLSATARPTVLAHELGHFFGNPHSTVVDNVMSYSRSGSDVFFDDAQKTIIRTYAARYLRNGDLADTPLVRWWP
ncbi:MAG: hypothetical protein ABIP39_07010 [Polyangiaceae bacterium]